MMLRHHHAFHLLLLLASSLLPAAAAAAATDGEGGDSQAISPRPGGRLHPRGWYLGRFEAWRQEHGMSFEFQEGRMARYLENWMDNR